MCLVDIGSGEHSPDTHVLAPNTLHRYLAGRFLDDEVGPMLLKELPVDQ